MMTLRRKVLVLVSAIVVTLALVVLPGCKREGTGGTKPKQTTPTSAKKLPTTGME